MKQASREKIYLQQSDATANNIITPSVRIQTPQRTMQSSMCGEIMSIIPSYMIKIIQYK